MKTWQAEGAVVAVVLGTTALVTGGWRAWLGAVAVQLTFHHAAIADRLTERQALRTVADVDCWRWSTRLFMAKEGCWFVYFAATGSWPALVGVVVFLLYPPWRTWYRHHYPVGRP